MDNLEMLYSFSNKWLYKFCKPDIEYLELIDHEFADDCRKFGFSMDCGKSFSDKYEKAFGNVEALVKIIDEVDDIALLGSAIFSKWRYFNHYAYSGTEILEPENRRWFIVVLERLKKISDADLRSKGYFTEIEYPFEKKADIKNFLSSYNIIEHTNKEKDYEYLEDNDVSLEIINACNGANLDIELSGEFTLFFDTWHAHYFCYEMDYNDMKHDILDILQGRVAAVGCYIGNKLRFSRLVKREELNNECVIDLIKASQNSEEYLKEAKVNGGYFKVSYWNKEECCIIDIFKD